MYTTTADVTAFARLIDRLERTGDVPIALYGAGRVAAQIEPLAHARPGSIAGVIDDDPGRHGEMWAGLEVIGREEAIARGVRAVIITAEGGAQDAIWAGRGPLLDAGLRVFCCPPRFASRTWDACLIEHHDHTIAAGRGIDTGYDRTYPAADHREPGWLLDPLLDAVRPGADVCEIGTGSGLWTRHLIDRTGAYYAVDYSDRLLFEVMEHRFAAHRDRLRLCHDETASLAGVPDAGVDVLFSFDVFVHFKIDLVHQFLRSARRVLRPGGVALLHLADWNEHAIADYERHDLARHVGGHTIIYPNHPDWVARSAGACGLSFELVERRAQAYLARSRPLHA